MAETADVLDITTERLRRNAALSVTPASRNQRIPNWLDFTTSNIYEMFIAELPRRPRRVNDGEIYFTTTALSGTGHYMASEHFLHWNPFATCKVAPRARPELKLTVYDRTRERTDARAVLQAV